jgi:hypoxia up-regulated 1
MEFLDDFMTKITRNDFEERCSDLFEKVTEPIDKLLKRNNLTIADIDQFEAIGGAWRTQKIKELL